MSVLPEDTSIDGFEPNEQFDSNESAVSGVSNTTARTNRSNSKSETVRNQKRFKYNPFCYRDPENPDQYLVSDTEIAGESVYVFCLGLAPLGWCFAGISLFVQCVAMVTFWYAAQKPDKSRIRVANTDYMFGVPTCFPQSEQDAQSFPDAIFPLPTLNIPAGATIGKNVTAYAPFCDYEPYRLGTGDAGGVLPSIQQYTAFIMLIVLFTPSMAKALQLCFRGPSRLITVLLLMAVPLGTIVISYMYILATARTPTEVLVSVFVVTFINDFDESAYTALNSLFPVYVKLTVQRLGTQLSTSDLVLADEGSNKLEI